VSPDRQKSPQDRFAELFSETQNALRRYVRRLVRSSAIADDIVQESFARTFEQRERIQTPRAFVFSIARNLAADARRHDRLQQGRALGDFDPADVVSTDESPEGGLLAEERSQLLKKAVARLSPQCRAVFTLRAFHGCSHKEIAQRLNLTPKTVENHLARAVRETHEYLRRRYK
jgi:RNA polymerase sigma-70 factor (ECF subfamily)